MLPAVANGQPTEATPLGPATLMNVFDGPETLEGPHHDVLMSWSVTVGPGGAGGPVRLRVRDGGAFHVGDSVELPAAPGTYTFPAPRFDGDYRDVQLGLDQTTGGHEIVARKACDPPAGRAGDPCQYESIARFPSGPQPSDPPASSDPGAQLALVGTWEPDKDSDLLGDTTEDRTDLRLATTTTATNGTLSLAVTLTNAGPLTADQPEIDLSESGVTARWTGCRAMPWIVSSVCTLDAMAPGASRTLTLSVPATFAGRVAIAAKAEGPDLAPADNTAPVKAADPAVQLTAAKAKNGVAVTLKSNSAGRVHVKLRAGGRITNRTVYLMAARATTVTIHPVGRARRALRRASSASILVTRISGGSATAAAKLKL